METVDVPSAFVANAFSSNSSPKIYNYGFESFISRSKSALVVSSIQGIKLNYELVDEDESSLWKSGWIAGSAGLTSSADFCQIPPAYLK